MNKIEIELELSQQSDNEERMSFLEYVNKTCNRYYLQVNIKGYSICGETTLRE